MKDHGLKHLFTTPGEAERAPEPEVTSGPPVHLQEQRAQRPNPFTEQSAPEICVIVRLTANPAHARRALMALADQTRAGALEIIGIGSDEAAAAVALAPLTDIPNIRFVKSNDSSDNAPAVADAIRQATAPLITVMDWHALLAADFVEAVLHRTNDKWDALAPTFANANPGSGPSWAAMMGRLYPRANAAPFPTPAMPLSNVVFRSSFIKPLADKFATAFATGTLDRLFNSAGGTVAVEPEAQIQILNPSDYRSMMKERFLEGRWRASREASSRQLGFLSRLSRAFNARIFPLKRYKHVRQCLDTNADTLGMPKSFEATVKAGFRAESRGRAKGFLTGAGDAQQQLREIARNREATLIDSDRAQLFPEEYAERP